MTLSRWIHLSSRQLADCRVFKVREDRYRSERSAQEHDFFVIESSDWVNVVALTEQGEVLLVRQHRFGTGEPTLEIPGGMVDAGEQPIEAARRELAEETGFEAREVVPLGTIHPNPAIMPNTTHTFLALGCRQTREPHFDSTEEVELVKVPASAIDPMLVSGEISHALVAVAFLHWKLRGSPGLRPASAP